MVTTNSARILIISSWRSNLNQIYIIRPIYRYVNISMNQWFRIKAAPQVQQDDGFQTGESLPASWYRSSAMYDLGRRAISSRRWLLVSHEARFASPGDYVQITEATFNFLVIKDRQGQIRAHHNVCRHRAYPLVENERGIRASTMVDILSFPRLLFLARVTSSHSF